MSIRLHTVIEGPASAEVLVLANSLGTAIGMWDAQMPRLTERYRVLRYDLRGHGRSDVPSGPYEIADLGRDLLSVVADAGVERAHVAGVSIGAMSAMWAAAHGPERVDRLVLISTSARLGPPEAWAERAAKVGAGGTAAVVDAVVPRWFTLDFVERRPDELERVRRMFVTTPADGYAACCGAIERMDLEPELRGISAPTLVIAAADDPATPVHHMERIAALVPDARLEVVPHAAHLVNIQRAERVTDLILAHLARQERAR